MGNATTFFRLTQAGGNPGRGADLTTQVVRAFLAREKLRSRSAAVIFCDLQKAFDSVIAVRSKPFGQIRGSPTIL